MKAGGKVEIRRTGDEQAWKYNLSIHSTHDSTHDKRLEISFDSKLPEDIDEGVWQIDVIADTTQIARVMYAIEWYSQKPLPYKEVMHDLTLTEYNANCSSYVCNRMVFPKTFAVQRSNTRSDVNRVTTSNGESFASLQQQR